MVEQKEDKKKLDSNEIFLNMIFLVIDDSYDFREARPMVRE